MMRSLTLKLTLAFLVVSLTSAAVASIYLQQRTRSEFTRFLSNQYQSDMINVVTQYYSINGSWANVDDLMGQLENMRRIPEFVPAPGDQPPLEARHIPLMLVDANKVIVYSGSPAALGQQATDQEIAQGVPLEVDGETVGWLTISSRVLDRVGGTPERRFLDTINQVILISALVAMVVALLLGVALARTLTRPLRELTGATQALAKGELGTQVSIRSNDELGRLAESFNQMSADLASATQARRQMTADIAHDLRSPLSVILGYTEALADGKLPGTPEVFEVIYNEAGHLQRLIDDLRTLSLADAGELALYPQEVQPAALLENAAAAYRQLCDQRGIHLQVEIQPGTHPAVFVDPQRMAQVLGNLLSNALRYTSPDGNILLKAQSTEKTIELHVEDDGPGIAPEDQPFVFDRFYRSQKSRPHNGETGLGLAIARSLIEAQGGSIRLDSSPDQGAHFIISLPS
jgi:signal transduction histidine kinase